MDFSVISKKFSHETIIEIARKLKIGDKNIQGQLIDCDNKKGDSYMSKIFRLKIFNEKKECVVFIKTLPKTAAHRETFRCVEFFRNEIDFYTKVIPSFVQFQKQTGSSDIFEEYPKCLASFCDGENDFIVLEDISVDGFTAPCRQNYTEIETCSLILKVLGRFHAVSLAFKDQNPEEFSKVVDNVKENLFRENLKKWYGDFLKIAINVALNAIEKTYPDSEYLMKSQKFLTGSLFDEMIKMVNDKTAYSVIGHGDCWRPNFLTKFNATNGTPEKVKIIDFQLVRFGSPIFDIMFFIYNSTSQQQRTLHFERLLKDYHSSACDLIKSLGSNPEKVFPFDALKKELKKFGRFGCGFCIESLPLSMLDDEEITDLDSINFENSTLCDFWKIKPIENIENRERLADIFKHAIDNEFLN